MVDILKTIIKNLKVSHSKGNLTENRIKFKHMKTIMISRFWSNLSNFSKIEKISNSWRVDNVLYNILKNVIWRS